ncbi:MAG: hypothetical protein ABIM45_06415 [candidate division WOR-3 bacterium]
MKLKEAIIKLQRKLDRAYNKNEKPPMVIRTIIGYRWSRCNVEETRRDAKIAQG